MARYLYNKIPMNLRLKPTPLPDLNVQIFLYLQNLFRDYKYIDAHVAIKMNNYLHQLELVSPIHQQSDDTVEMATGHHIADMELKINQVMVTGDDHGKDWEKKLAAVLEIYKTALSSANSGDTRYRQALMDQKTALQNLLLEFIKDRELYRF